MVHAYCSAFYSDRNQGAVAHIVENVSDHLLTKAKYRDRITSDFAAHCFTVKCEIQNFLFLFFFLNLITDIQSTTWKSFRIQLGVAVSLQCEQTELVLQSASISHNKE